MTEHNSERDKVIDHTRVQLSALFDGELALDEARFLQRRLQHDPELGECVSRWQLAGDILRGQATAAAPAGFADRVAAAIAADAATVAAPAAARRPRLNWGSGVALAAAASVAAIALFMGRQAPDALISADAPQIGIASTMPANPQPAPAQPPAPSVPAAPDTAAQLAAASIAVAEVPRRVAARRGSSRAQLQRAAATRAARAAELGSSLQLAVASAPPTMTVANANPFDPSTTATTPRPWPRALLPNAGAAFNVGYGSLQRPAMEPLNAPAAPSVHPFRPRPATLQRELESPSQIVQDDDAKDTNSSPR